MENNLPEKFLQRLNEVFIPEKVKKILDAFSYKRPTTFRVNTLKISQEKLSEKLKAMGFEIEKVPWCQDAFILTNKTQKMLTETEFYKNGFLYIQSLSSMIPPLVLDPQKNEKILDLTAAPGSKTTQIAALMQNTGEIIANDKSHVRLYKLRANLALQGATNTSILQMSGETLWKKFPEYFDKTLVDVPCSMEGRFNLDDEKSYKDWSTNKIKILQSMQKFLLRSAVSATKKNGIIIYSTCTLTPEENEAVIDWIIKKEDGAVITEKINIDNLLFDNAIEKWRGKEFSTEIKNAIRINPSKNMEGFFISKLRKIKNTLLPEGYY